MQKELWMFLVSLQGEQNRVILIGGGNVGLRIAKTLERSENRIRAKIIEKDRSRAEFSAGSLERTIVLAR